MDETCAFSFSICNKSGQGITCAIPINLILTEAKGYQEIAIFAGFRFVCDWLCGSKWQIVSYRVNTEN